MAKDRLDNPRGFNKYYDIAAKAADFGNKPDGAKWIAKDGSTSVSPNKRIHRQNPLLIPSKTTGGKDRVYTDTPTLWEDSRFPDYEKSSQESAISHRQIPPLASHTDGHFLRKTKTKSTATSSSSSRPKYPFPSSSKQKQNTNCTEPKSILKNSPRRRGSIASDDDGLTQTLKQTSIQHVSSSPSSSQVVASPVGTAVSVAGVSQQSDPADPVRGGEMAHDLLSRLRICYSRSISERLNRANLYKADMVSQRDWQGSEEEILSRCSYRLSPCHRRSSEPSASKRVTFHDQSVRIGDGAQPPKY